MNTRENVEKLIIEKAMKDDLFREQIISNPRETISAEIGINIPDSFNIRVLQEDANTFYLVLPPVDAKNEDGELSEAELLHVSGGDDPLGTQCSIWSWIVTQCDAC